MNVSCNRCVLTNRFRWPFLIAALLALTLLLMGRTPWCSCGVLIPWSWEVNSRHNSQHIIDWYTFSHLLHGFIFYWITGLFGKRWSISQRLITAMLFESGWEVLENSPIIIERYRSATIALDYYGDSVANSLSDLFSCVCGFILASKLQVRTSIAIIVFAELFVLACIRDNLTLNVLMLVWPIDAIKVWQGGA